MNPQSIRVFLAIVEHKSISAAARALYFSQPTVSEHLRQLEKRLGIQLFLREKGTRHVTLTAAGAEFLPLARRWHELDLQTRRFVDMQQKKVLRLAASSGAHGYIVSHIAHKLMQTDPELEVRLSTVEIREMASAVSQCLFDAAFVFKDCEYSQMRTVPFFEEERYVLCPADTILPDRIIRPEELDLNYEIISDSSIRNKKVCQWRDEMHLNGGEPYFKVSSLMSVHNYLDDPRCWSIVPASVALLLVSQYEERLAIRRLDPTPPPRTAYLLIAESYPHKEVIDRLLSCCYEYVCERTYLRKMLPT